MASIARLNQHVVALLASTSGLAVGASLGWNSLAGDGLRAAMGWEVVDANLVCGALAAGAGLGALCLPVLLQWRIGTSAAIAYAAAPLLLLGWILVCLADYSYPLLLIGRSLSGLGVGGLSTLIPLYVAEVSTPGQRDSLLLYFHAMLGLGVLCSYGVAYLVSCLEADVLPLQLHSAGCTLACLPAVLCCLAPASPLQRVDLEDGSALRALAERDGGGGDEGVTGRQVERTHELARALQRPTTFQNKTKMLRNARFWRIFAIVGCTTACQQLSGWYSVICNVLVLLEYTGSGQLTPTELSLVCAACQTLSSLLAVLLVRCLGRRFLLTASAMLMGLLLILLGWFITIKETYPKLNYEHYWLPASWIALYFSAYGLGLGPISAALLADSFPVELRVLAASTIVGLGWFLCLALNLQLFDLLTYLGLAGTLWLFAGFSWLGAGIAGIAVRESAGKSLADVQEDFRIG